MLSGSFSSECVTDTPTHWIHAQLSLFFSLRFVSVWELVAVLRMFLTICFRCYFVVRCFTKKSEKPFLPQCLFLPSISTRLAFITSFLSTSFPLSYRFLSLFAFYFPFLITSIPSCVLSPSASHSRSPQSENITHYLHSEGLTIVSALFLWTAPNKHTHTPCPNAI